MRIAIEPHPSARPAVFMTDFRRRLADVPSSTRLIEHLASDAAAPLQRDERVRACVRDVLRHGGYKPTGRGKPASEYLVRQATQHGLGTINAAVDACNAVSLHSGFPVSVVDAERLVSPLRIGLAAHGTSYVFNVSGQVIDVSGLLCLHDAEGPCANAVKDAQRTKTQDATTRTLSVVWGARGLEERLDAALAWYRELLHELGAATHIAALTGDG